MIDWELQKELRQKFNPEGSLLRRQQLRMLEMLKYIDHICLENDISYWLSSGTCLGAVRHGGFIPWDDDVDIEMLKKDYDKLLRIIKRDRDCPYILHNHSTDRHFVSPFSKLRDKKSELHEDKGFDLDQKFSGLYIDIFQLESSNSKKLALVGKYLCLMCLSPCLLKNKKIRSVSRKILYFITYNILRPPIRFLSKIKFRKDGRLRHSIGNVFIKPRSEKDIFPLKRILFEDSYFNVPNSTHDYLKKLYGDYMRLPSLDDIIIHSSDVKFLD